MSLLITDMAAWIAAHPVVFQSYWMSDASSKCSLMDGTKPKSAAAYKAAWPQGAGCSRSHGADRHRFAERGKPLRA